MGQMIDKSKVKAFWDARAEKYGMLDFNSIANLEEDPINLALKIELETSKVFEYMQTVEGRSILDLGAGVGQWAFRFIERGASRVVAVEYSKALADLGRKEAQARNVTNLDFVVSAAEEYLSDTPFDVVFISGLFVYMNDDQAEKLAMRLSGHCKNGASLLLRDGTAVESRYVIDNRLSEHLKTQYSAVYRTADEYRDLFVRAGFTLQKHENMFEEGCPLNKYPETRLRIYRFVPAGVGGE
jgi:SAM-dependent methyltransferase